MDFSTDVRDLAKAVSLCSRAAATRSVQPILGGILIEAADGGSEATLTATDGEVSISTGVDAEVLVPGSAIVQAKLSTELLKSLGSSDGIKGEVRVRIAPDGRVEITDEAGHDYMLPAYNAGDFPQIPAISSEGAFSVDSRAIGRCVAKVGRSASKDETRPVLTGALVTFSGEQGAANLHMVTTDSYRLTIKEEPIEPDSALPEEGLSAVIPFRALREVSAIRNHERAKQDKRSSGSESMAVDESAEALAASSATGSAAALEGEYANNGEEGDEPAQDATAFAEAEAAEDAAASGEREESGEQDYLPALVQVGGNAAVIRIGSTTLASRTIAGDFPDYARLLPQSTACVASMPRASFVEALKRVSIFAGTEDRIPLPIRMRLKPRSDAEGLTLEEADSGGDEQGDLYSAELYAKSESGEAREYVEGVRVEGDMGEYSLETGFNPSYLADAVGLLEADRMQMRLNAPLQPAVVVPESGEAGDHTGLSDGFLHLLMPMRFTSGEEAEAKAEAERDKGTPANA